MPHTHITTSTPQVEPARFTNFVYCWLNKFTNASFSLLCSQKYATEKNDWHIKVTGTPTGIFHLRRACSPTSSQAKGTNSTSFLPCVRNEVELVPLACKDGSPTFSTLFSANKKEIACLFNLILYVPSTINQLYRDGSSLVEPVLS